MSLVRVLVCAGLLACGPKTGVGPIGASEKPGTRVSLDAPVVFSFESLDERPVSSDAMRGRPSLLVFAATGDLLSQAQVDYVVAMAKHDADRVNYALVVFQSRREIALVSAYSHALGVPFPVALAGSQMLNAHGGPFGDLPAVPTVVLLDELGRVSFKKTGLVKPDEIREQLHRH